MIKNKNKYKTLYSFDIGNKGTEYSLTSLFLNKFKEFFYFNRKTNEFELRMKEGFYIKKKSSEHKDFLILNLKIRVRRLKDINLDKYRNYLKDIQQIENSISKFYELFDQIFESYQGINMKRFISYHIHIIENLKELNNSNSFKKEVILYYSLYLMYILNVINDSEIKYKENLSMIYGGEQYKMNTKNYLMFNAINCINEIKNLNIKIQEDLFTNQVYLFISSKSCGIDSLGFHIVLNDYLFFKEEILLKLKEVIKKNSFDGYNKNIILGISSYYLNGFYRQ